MTYLEPPLDGPPHPAIKRALSAYLDAAYMAARAQVEHETSARVRRQYAAHLRRKGERALAEVCGGARA